MRLFALAGATCLLMVGGVGAAAAQDRADLIQSARLETDEQARRNLYVEAANPSDADSLWAVSVYEIAQIVRDLGDNELAGTWIRWATRHGEWTIDPIWFAPSLVTFYEQVAADVTEDPDPEVGAAATEWRWADQFSATDPGTLEVAATDGDVPLTVAVVGQDDLGGGESASLPAGTYQLVASAEGYDTVRVEREVLPGAATLVSFEMLPVLSDEVAQRVFTSVVRLRRAGTQVCSSAIAMSGDLAVTALSSLGGATSVEVPRPGGAVGAQVVQTDPASDLAVVSIPGLGAPSLSRTSLSDQMFGWSVSAPACAGPLDVARLRIEGGGVPGMPAGALGSPLVDRSGSLMGLLTQGGQLASLGGIDELVAAAAEQIGPEGGGFPVTWVVLGGAAVAGGVVALLLGGGETTPSTPTTGSITIAIPSS